jgi:hypothetical protein
MNSEEISENLKAKLVIACSFKTGTKLLRCLLYTKNKLKRKHNLNMGSPVKEYAVSRPPT